MVAIQKNQNVPTLLDCRIAMNEREQLIRSQNQQLRKFGLPEIGRDSPLQSKTGFDEQEQKNLRIELYRQEFPPFDESNSNDDFSIDYVPSTRIL